MNINKCVYSIVLENFAFAKCFLIRIVNFAAEYGPKKAGGKLYGTHRKGHFGRYGSRAATPDLAMAQGGESTRPNQTPLWSSLTGVGLQSSCREISAFESSAST